LAKKPLDSAAPPGSVSRSAAAERLASRLAAVRDRWNSRRYAPTAVSSRLPASEVARTN
jgi:hypothetical protein